MKAALHPWRKIVGLTNPRAKTIKIECACGHVTEGVSVKAAMGAHERHQAAATAEAVKEAT